MLHAKFRDHRILVLQEKAFTIYGHGGHLGHVTWTILYKLFPQCLNIVNGCRQ